MPLMNRQQTKMIHIVAIILCGVSLFLQLFCLVTPYWMYKKIEDDDDDDEPMTFVGLWQMCFTKSFRTGDQHVCQSIGYSKKDNHKSLDEFEFPPDLTTDNMYEGDPRSNANTSVISSTFVPDSMQWTRFVEILGTMMISGALFCGLMKHFVFIHHEKLLKAGMACGFSAGGFMLIGIFSLVGESDNGELFDYLDLKFHASFGLCIVAALVACTAGTMFFLWERNDSADRVQKGQETVGPMDMGSVKDDLS